MFEKQTKFTDQKNFYYIYGISHAVEEFYEKA